MHSSSESGSAAASSKMLGSTSVVIGFPETSREVVKDPSPTFSSLVRERIISSGFSAADVREGLRRVFENFFMVKFLLEEGKGDVYDRGIVCYGRPV